MNLLVVGKTGVGKSRLTNALLGKDMAREGHTDVTTKDADVFSLDVNGVRINIWDTPGQLSPLPRLTSTLCWLGGMWMQPVKFDPASSVLGGACMRRCEVMSKGHKLSLLL